MDRSEFTLASLRLGERQSFAKAQRPKGSRRNRLRFLLRLTIAAVVLTLLAISTLFIYSYRAYAKIVDARLARGYLGSRAGIYAAPRTLRPGQKLSQMELAAVLQRAGY